jgi:hypothetical protein
MGEYARKLRARTLGNTQAPTAAADAPKQMTNSEFLHQRQMFCVIDGIPYVAAPNDSRYHREWMNELVDGGHIDDRTYNQSPRGFYLAPDMVWYRGPMQPVGMRDITEKIAVLTLMMALPQETMVYSGARSGHDDVLKGVNMIGTIQDISEY